MLCRSSLAGASLWDGLSLAGDIWLGEMILMPACPTAALATRLFHVLP